eukprot:5711665-Pleurochrysis_carterae.AAC.3
MAQLHYFARRATETLPLSQRRGIPHLSTFTVRHRAQATYSRVQHVPETVPPLHVPVQRVRLSEAQEGWPPTPGSLRHERYAVGGKLGDAAPYGLFKEERAPAEHQCRPLATPGLAVPPRVPAEEIRSWPRGGAA